MDVALMPRQLQYFPPFVYYSVFFLYECAPSFVHSLLGALEIVYVLYEIFAYMAHSTG